MADENYIDLYTATDEETGEETEGMIVKGKDVVMLDAPEVLLSPETPLLTEAQDVAGAINELFGLGAKGGDFRAIADNGEDSIYVNLDTSDSSGGANCAYTYFDFSESITTTTTTTVGDTTTTTENTVTFTKRIITELINAETETLLLKTSYDESTGEILGYTDRNDAAVYIGGGAVSNSMSGNADIGAIVWVLCKNQEQAESFEKQKKAYRQGLSEGEGVTEEWDTEDDTIEFDVDEDGNGTDPALIDFDKGIQLNFVNPDDPTDTITVRFRLDHSEDGDYSNLRGYVKTVSGKPVLESYDSTGTLLSQTYFIERIDYTPFYHTQYHKNGWNPNGLPTYVTKYRIKVTNGTVYAQAYVIKPTTEAWTNGASTTVNIAIPSITIPDGYVYTGAKNYDSTAAT